MPLQFLRLVAESLYMLKCQLHLRNYSTSICKTMQDDRLGFKKKFETEVHFTIFYLRLILFLTARYWNKITESNFHFAKLLYLQTCLRKVIRIKKSSA